MPELPEVETMRRGILGVVGSTIKGIERERCSCKPILIQPRIDAFRRRAVGREIVELDRIGKRVVVRLDSHDMILFEPRMTGLVLLADPPDPDHLRFRIDLSGKIHHVWYWDRRGLGSVRLMSPSDFNDLYGPDKLGPDALAITAKQLRERLGGSRRAVKVALLDQRAVAGIGNLYASEILHLAAIHPAKRCDRITRAEWQRIREATQEVLLTAIRYEGSTLSDGTYRNALNKAGGYQNQHRVYDREGVLCPTCESGVIIRVVQAQRSTFFCPECQSKRRSARTRIS